MGANLLSGVLRLRDAGLSTIPIKTDGSKAPALPSWKLYQERLPNDGELRSWFGNGARPGVALIGGAVSGNLEVIDFDAPELIAEWRELVESAAPGLLEQLPQVETPSGGLHILYRCATIDGNSKLAQKADGVTLIETRGQGGYIVTVGSPAACHPSGKTYKLINGNLKAIPEITPTEREILLDCARSFNERLKPEPEPAPTTGPSSGLRPGDDYNQRGDSRADLERHGWRYVRPGPRGELWRRPDKERGASATRFVDGSLYVFSTNAAPFEIEREYKPFSIRAWLDYGGDFGAAAKALAGEGYGERTATKKAGAQGEKKEAQPPEVVAHAAVLNKILKALQPCDFHELGGFQPQSEIKQKHYVVLCVQELLRVVAERKFALARKNDFIFVYNGEYWREIDRETLKVFLGDTAEHLGVVPIEARHYEFKDKLYKQFLAAAHFEQAEPENGKALINLRNGSFEITADGQRLRDFNPADFLKYQLPFDYNEEAQAPVFTAYLNRVLPEPELQNIVSEFFGYVFTRRLKLEKALLLYGSGANGKSVLFDVMNALLGRENTANYSLSDLMQEHNRAQIAHKLLNYGSEINASVTKDVFKNLVSGEAIMARLKYGNSFLMEDYAKLCFNCNCVFRAIVNADSGAT